jgi:hypothetical protein
MLHGCLTPSLADTLRSSYRSLSPQMAPSRTGITRLSKDSNRQIPSITAGPQSAQPANRAVPSLARTLDPTESTKIAILLTRPTRQAQKKHLEFNLLPRGPQWTTPTEIFQQLSQNVKDRAYILDRIRQCLRDHHREIFICHPLIPVPISLLPTDGDRALFTEIRRRWIDEEYLAAMAKTLGASFTG